MKVNFYVKASWYRLFDPFYDQMTKLDLTHHLHMAIIPWVLGHWFISMFILRLIPGPPYCTRDLFYLAMEHVLFRQVECSIQYIYWKTFQPEYKSCILLFLMLLFSIKLISLLSLLFFIAFILFLILSLLLTYLRFLSLSQTNPSNHEWANWRAVSGAERCFWEKSPESGERLSTWGAGILPAAMQNNDRGRSSLE